MSGLGAMFFRGSGGAGRRGMQGRGHTRRARTESGPGGAQGARDCFALVCPRHEASCSFSEKSRGLVFSKILPSRATFSKILLLLRKVLRFPPRPNLLVFFENLHLIASHGTN